MKQVNILEMINYMLNTVREIDIEAHMISLQEKITREKITQTSII